MKYTAERLNQLKEQMYSLSKLANQGTLDRAEAADKITEIREQIDEILNHLQNSKQVSSLKQRQR